MEIGERQAVTMIMIRNFRTARDAGNVVEAAKWEQRYTERVQDSRLSPYTASSKAKSPFKATYLAHCAALGVDPETGEVAS